MKFKGFSVAMLISGLLFLLIGFALFYFALQSYTSVNDGLGIIGGADVPTYRFVLIQSIKGWPLCLILFGAAFFDYRCVLFDFQKNSYPELQHSYLGDCSRFIHGRRIGPHVRFFLVCSIGVS